MNKAFYIIAIPAFIVSFCWLYFGWGLKIALATILLELAAAIAGVIYLRRKAEREAANERTSHGKVQAAQHGAGTRAR